MNETDTPRDAAQQEDAVPQEQARPRQVEEWPPREWRETTRAAGRRQALYVALGMIVIFAVLVVVAIWGSHNGCRPFRRRLDEPPRPATRPAAAA